MLEKRPKEGIRRWPMQCVAILKSAWRTRRTKNGAIDAVLEGIGSGHTETAGVHGELKEERCGLAGSSQKHCSLSRTRSRCTKASRAGSRRTSPSPILDMILRPGNVMIGGSENLKDCYITFVSATSVLVETVWTSVLQVVPRRLGSLFIRNYPLRTMAMGDVNAVECGQAAQRFEDMLVMRGRPPRKNVAAGLVINVLIAVEQVPDSSPVSERSSAIADDMVGKLPMPRRDSLKRFAAAFGA